MIHPAHPSPSTTLPALPAPLDSVPADHGHEDGGSAGLEPEALDYLFADAASAPASPAALPVPAGPMAATPAADGSVRAALARKLCRLLPGLPADTRSAATQAVCRTLEALARDHIVHVRAALASAIKDVACAPPPVVRQLAQDVERTVAEPILRCCAALPDRDLLDIIAAHPAGWALAAIAGRARVNGPVSSAIAGAGDAAATGILLDNTGAIIPEPVLERLTSEARHHPDWGDKLARRPAFPPRLAVKLAAFVDRAVVEALKARPDFDDATVAEIAVTVRRRVDWIESRDPAEGPERRAVRLHRLGRLDEASIGDALSWDEAGFVHAALALASGVDPAVVTRILESGNPRAVTALVWRCGFGMRCAMMVQARVARIAPRSMLNARMGTEFPLSPADMRRSLAHYGAMC
ncbi:uncharacterized protein (DUF2336 family) [Azospirillum fermentarium]|uniref:DUF2336 domain-containing protein n=1 Tax=Azospirillum fermentarium TaxID=1233114 RepID=UPI0022260B60|nr:DUF2336 domain-containing protein [Azospirillum fermentarium]MCW2247282.1 uncharacterized protein (DUF2336 family) [Azospirillum fermentarium]